MKEIQHDIHDKQPKAPTVQTIKVPICALVLSTQNSVINCAYSAAPLAYSSCWFNKSNPSNFVANLRTPFACLFGRFLLFLLDFLQTTAPIALSVLLHMLCQFSLDSPLCVYANPRERTHWLCHPQLSGIREVGSLESAVSTHQKEQSNLFHVQLY